MSESRTVSEVLTAVQAMDGAGVKLRRVFGHGERHRFDPFLMMDHFGSDRPKDYLAGFPWHPHRGIETVTYLLAGKVAHGDSMGNKGVIGPGDGQWMTAGSGIIHQEMPEQNGSDPRMEGFQLWVNLPAKLKMTTPRYRAVEAGEIPRFRKDGCEIGILAGEFEGHKGATPDLFIPIIYLIVHMDPGAKSDFHIPAGFNAAAYLHEGAANFGGTLLKQYQLGHLPGREDKDAGPVAEATDRIEVAADPAKGASFLLIAGHPLHEPIAWGGPIVMNTREELQQAFEEYDRGTFIKSTAAAN